jgi:hypothetical protein
MEGASDRQRKKAWFSATSVASQRRRPREIAGKIKRWAEVNNHMDEESAFRTSASVGCCQQGKAPIELAGYRTT